MTEAPYRSRKLVVAALGMFLINVAAAMASPYFGVPESVVMAVIEWQAYITLSVIGAQGLIDHIKAKGEKE